MSKCGKTTEVYSRVCGYFRPVSNWNKGKKEEFANRKTYNLLGMLVAVIALVAIATGCTTSETLASGIAEKSISGSGTITINKVGLNTTTQTPELSSIWVFGDYTSLQDGDNVIRYEVTEDTSIFNTDCKSKNTKLFYASSNQEQADELFNTLLEKVTTEVEAEQSDESTEDGSGTGDDGGTDETTEDSGETATTE